MSNKDDKSSSSNGLGPDPQQRLASFKPPRDLTLGGVKPNKKVFTPNLNVARNKNKGPILNTARDQRKDDRGKRDRKNDRNRNIKNGPNIIKSGGVFSEGLGATERHSSRASYGSRDSGDTAATLQKPTIRVKDIGKIDKELEEQKIKSVMGRDDPSDDEEDFKNVPEKDAPIKLPMDIGVWDKPKPAVQVKQEVIVKDEPGVETDCSITSVTRPVSVKQEVFEENDVVNLLKAEQPTLILLQLPDTLPGRGNSEPEPSTSSGDASEEAPPADNRCRLADLEEGRIGSLRVHQSGRVTLALGDTIFEVSAGTKAAFHQEAVAVTSDEASRSADIVSLGALQHKLNLMPDWETMFCDMPV
ncbi:DNA-directed RNA polymerase III subunit RPC4-like isoform X1 [Choristoneura fumiferana]|uniref:DNA-directed RNA polymerase III subunit RPC4-like isoform X1 n=1 Tax=Choristoneura fumiferana TaxID=7141 RepID=UPI003D1559F5